MQVRDTGPGNGAHGSGDGPRVDLPPPPSQVPPGHYRMTASDYPRPSSSDYVRPSDHPLPPRSSDGLRLEPPTAAPRRRLPELVLGIFLVAGCALAAVLLAAAGRERTPALALATDVERGEIIDAGDLNTIYIGSDADVAFVDPDDVDLIVDRAALSSLSAGTLVTPEQFADPEAITSSGDATIGLALEAGQLPSLHLAPGDTVVVVAGGGAAGSQDAPQVVADAATVESVSEIQDNSGQQSRWWVSLRLSENDATNLAMANASNARVQLVMVER